MTMSIIKNVVEPINLISACLITLSYEQRGARNEAKRILHMQVRDASPDAASAVPLAARATLVEDARALRPVWHPENPDQEAKIWFPETLVLTYRFAEAQNFANNAFIDPDRAGKAPMAIEIDKMAEELRQALTADNSSRVTHRIRRSVERGKNIWILPILIEPNGNTLTDSPLNNLIAADRQVRQLFDQYGI